MGTVIIAIYCTIKFKLYTIANTAMKQKVEVPMVALSLMVMTLIFFACYKLVYRHQLNQTT